jgi:DNA-binding SARP family transcriptional activator
VLLIKLLGRPTVLADGVEVEGPRGNKAWGLLAYLIGSGAPVPRDRLARLLFPDAEDGLAALRWNLAQLRRMVGRPQAFAGDPVVLALGPMARVDVQLLAAAPWYEVMDQVELGAPLLEGLAFRSCAGFEMWLEGERHRVVGLAAAALREAARAEGASGRPEEAAQHARRLVSLEPWDENAHELLVRALAQAGDVAAARAHVERVTELFLDELGMPPSRSLAAAAEPMLARPAAASVPRTLAQLQAGMTAMSAGAPEAGVDALRRAVAGARAVADPELLVRALTALGSGQVHAVRGSDESGVAALREAVTVAERVGRPELATTACRELAWVEFLRCRFEPAERWLDRAMVTVGADDSERAWILLIRGSLRSDAGRHADAVPLLREGLRHAENAGDLRAAAMALTHLGRLYVLRQEHEEALACLRQARRLAEEAGWLSFVPYPSSWLAELALRAGRVEEAADLFGHAHALALEVGDPCWESIACRGLGLVAAAKGDDDTAARLLHDAPAACRRLSDTYVWIEAYGLAAQAAHAVACGLPRGAELVDDLDRLTSTHGMRELQASAALLRLRAGLPGALDAAKGLLAAVDNPVLARQLEQLEHDLSDRLLSPRELTKRRGQGLDQVVS